METRNSFDLPMFWHMPELCDLSVSRKRKLCDDVTELFLFLEFKEKISKFQHAISLLIKKNVNIPERSRNKNVLYSPVAGVQKYVPSLTESNYEEKGNIMYMNETHN